MRDDPFDTEEIPMTSGDLRIKYVYESWDGHIESGSDGRRYRYEDQLQDFQEKVNTFLEEHDVYDISVEKSADKHGQVRHEAWIIYEL